MRHVSAVALNDYQVALIYSLVLLAVVQKTGSTARRPGEPRYRDVRDRWLACTAEELEEVRARLAEARAPDWGAGRLLRGRRLWSVGWRMEPRALSIRSSRRVE